MLANFKSYQMALELYKKCESIKAKAFLKDQLEVHRQTAPHFKIEKI